MILFLQKHVYAKKCPILVPSLDFVVSVAHEPCYFTGDIFTKADQTPDQAQDEDEDSIGIHKES